MKFLKKIMTLASFVLIYGSNCFAHQVERPTEELQEEASSGKITAENNTKYDEEISVIMNIIENEHFVMKEVFFDGFRDVIRNCVFESPSAVWTIRYCEDPENILMEGVWYSMLAGDFKLKDNTLWMDYYLELDGKKHIYAEFGKYGQYAVNSLAMKRMSFIKEFTNDDDQSGSKVVRMRNWSEKRLPFLQTLARTQERYINRSIASL